MAPLGGRGGGRDGKQHPVASVAASSTSALVELIVFHPIDTAAKRIITHQGRLLTSHGLSLDAKLGLMHDVVFREKTRARPAEKLLSLFPGIRHAVAYKNSQRTLTYGTQPHLFRYLHEHHHDAFVQAVGQKRARNLEFSTAAAVVGMGEIVFLPFDTLKILHQTNPASVQGRSFFEIARQEGVRKLYRGALWTALRNAPGSFALFGGSALVKEQVFHLQDYADATVFQDIVASTSGAIWSLTVSSPCDVIKARVQRASIGGGEVRGLAILKELLRKEGPLALFKGLTTKCLVVGPKLVMSFTLYSQLMARLDKLLQPSSTSAATAKQQQQQPKDAGAKAGGAAAAAVQAKAGTAPAAALSPVKQSKQP